MSNQRDDSSNHRNRRFLARYGATILRGGIATIPKALYRYQAELGLKPQQVWFISAILTHKWDQDMPKPSLKRMAPQTGVSLRQLHNYKDELVATGWLTIVHRHNARGGQETSYYDFSALFGALEERLERDKPRPRGDEQGEDDDEDELDRNGDVENSARRAPGGVNPSAPRGVQTSLPRGVNPSSPLKESVDKEAFQKEPSLFSNSIRSPSLHKYLSATLSEENIRERNKLDRTSVSGTAGTDTKAPAMPGGFAAVGDMLAQRQSRAPGPTRAGIPPRRGRPLKTPPYIEQVITEFSVWLHDEEHTASNITQATRLWQHSDMPEERFVQEVLYKARSLTQAQGNVKKRATGGAGLINRVPYFFAVVRDLLGMTERGPDVVADG